MEGDLIATIKKSHQYIAHYHTGGVPGRNDIDDTQEERLAGQASLWQQLRHRYRESAAADQRDAMRASPPTQVMSASLVSSDSTRHQCGSKSAPSGQTLSL